MPRLYLVRHARPAALWGEDPDPGLDALGRTQALATAERLAERLPRLDVYSSPLRRCRETAAPLAEIWRAPVRIHPQVAEIPAPALDAAARRDWLSAAMRGSWRDLQRTAPPGSPDYLAWRRTLLDSLLATPGDAVVCTHFIAINAVVGAAHGSDAVMSFRPDHASVTIVDAKGGRFELVELGREAETNVLTGAPEARGRG
jgi:broad specificity phosphatase PhoE